jgi:hypothetical protein
VTHNLRILTPIAGGLFIVTMLGWSYWFIETVVIGIP